MTENASASPNPLADYFDRCAEDGIFETFSPEELPVVRGLLSQMSIQSGDKVVEAGCGVGRLTEMLAELVGPKGKVFAFDISPRMVEGCRERGLPPQVEIAQACAADLPPPDGEFDAVVCHNAFPHFEDKPAALREFRRLLRKDGILCIAHSRSREWVNSLHASIGILSTHFLPDRREFENLLRETGFSLEFLHDLPDRYLLKAASAS